MNSQTLAVQSSASTSARGTRFACSTPGCHKSFTRKEHLTRHAKSHSKQLHYQCPICGRRYARSDVFKRHVEYHPQNAVSSSKIVACSECHVKKLKCDNETPCRQCNRHGLECVRKGRPSEIELNTSPEHGSPVVVPAVNNASSTATSVDGSDNAQGHWTGVQFDPAGAGEYFHQQNSSPALAAIAPPTPPISLSSDSSQSFGSQLRGLLQGIDEPTTYFLLEIYFTEIHPYWPILHVSTFNIGTASELLLGSVLALASWITGREEHKTFVPALYEDALAATRVNVTPSLHTLQGMVLLVVYSIYNMKDELGKACRVISILIQSCRCIGIFNGSHSLPERLQGDGFTFWLAKEQLHRLAYTVFRLDTYLSVILNIAPTVRYQELYIPFLSSPFVWEATDGDDLQYRLQKQPQHEEVKSTFLSGFHREFMYSPTPSAPNIPLLPMDHHLTLCALQAPIWEASAFSTDMEISLMSIPNSPVFAARAHLERWHARLRTHCETQQLFQYDVVEEITWTLFHMAKMTMHAPLPLLRIYSAAPSGKHHDVDTEKVAAKLGIWRGSPCPRMGVISCAEICQLLSHDPLAFGPTSLGAAARRNKLNPLATPALLMAAIVICSYAAGVGQKQGSGCPSCLPGLEHEHGGCVDIFAGKGPKSQQRVKEWEATGRGWPVWGATGIVLCRCGLDKLGEWFLHDTLLGRDETAMTEFVAFLEGLKSGLEQPFGV
ncbi:fungal-specific transcription factor domain-containing protein [Triangularia verruculosa]|uniref:Fungal-specific transcription factor domain-containing protein n=1 Tax=Triangularia verruculosa TaxID=2587418 RepID=A0AAN6XDI3_9PEZI|nr:fungal-specific transcription factor domain-containing protein [Triangularia verruculosa]